VQLLLLPVKLLLFGVAVASGGAVAAGGAVTSIISSFSHNLGEFSRINNSTSIPEEAVKAFPKIFEVRRR
jgi:hypothetical protein